MVTRDNEFSNPVPEFLTEHIPPRTVLNQSNCDHNDALDTTLPAPEQDPPLAAQDPIHRLADVLPSLQNGPSAQQQLNIRPVDSNAETRANREFFPHDDQDPTRDGGTDEDQPCKFSPPQGCATNVPKHQYKQ